MELNSLEQLDEVVSLASKLVKVEIDVKMHHDSHVPNVMILMRVLPSVAVVNQSSKVERSDAFGTNLGLYVKFLPKGGTLYKNLISLCKMIKGIPGVKIIKVKRVGGRTVTFKGQSIVI